MCLPLTLAKAVQGFAEGGRRIVFAPTTEPPAGRCTDMVLADCKASWPR